MGSMYDFEVPKFNFTQDCDPCLVDSFFDKKEKELGCAAKNMSETAAMVSSTTDKHNNYSHRRTRVTFSAENKENICLDKYSLAQRLNTPKPVKVAEQESGDDSDLLLKIESLTIDSNSKKVRTPTRNTRRFDGIEIPPSSEKTHRMRTRSDVHASAMKLRNRSVQRPGSDIFHTPEDKSDSMHSAVSSTSNVINDSGCSDLAMANVADDESRRATYDCGEFALEHGNGALSMPSGSQLLRPSAFDYGRLKRSSAHFDDIEAIKSADNQPKKFVALAEQIANFHKNTPDRFRSKPLPWRPVYSKQDRLGVPCAPKLMSTARSRPVHYLGQQHKEQQEYEEMKKHHIKANPVNERILSGVCMGLKAPILTKPITRFEAFNLTVCKPKAPTSEEVYKFTAQPAPKRILEKVVGVPPKKIKPPVTPKTPAITMPVRVRASPVTSQSGSQSSSTEKLCRAAVQPFSFHDRDKQILARKEELIKKVLEEEKKGFSSFKAQPVRHFTMKNPTPLKAMQPKKTEIVPFNLTQPKGIKEQPEVKPEFKAQPASVLKKRPFMPRYEKPPTPKAMEFHFETEKRCFERRKFEEMLEKKNEECEKITEQLREENEKKANEAAKAQRRQAEFKAHPVPKMKLFQLKECDIPLTQPITPTFEKKPAQGNKKN